MARKERASNEKGAVGNLFSRKVAGAGGYGVLCPRNALMNTGVDLPTLNRGGLQLEETLKIDSPWAKHDYDALGILGVKNEMLIPSIGCLPYLPYSAQ
jgi:hypothetical protein